MTTAQFSALLLTLVGPIGWLFLGAVQLGRVFMGCERGQNLNTGRLGRASGAEEGRKAGESRLA